MNFDLYLPVEVIFGVGSVNKVGEVRRLERRCRAFKSLDSQRIFKSLEKP